MQLSEQQLLEIRLEMEKLITRRDGMLAQNKLRSEQGLGIEYGNFEFDGIVFALERLRETLTILGEQ